MLSLLIVIPARGGSKGIPQKNITLLAGRPLLSYTIAAAQAAALPNSRLVVSTDAPAIAAVAAQHQVEVIHRPADISHDTASTESALLHALATVAATGFQPEAILTLAPTSPLRRPETIQAFVAHFMQVMGDYDALLSLHEDRSDYWVTEDGVMRRLFPDAPRRRQDRQPLYIENSALYITTVSALQTAQSVLGTRPAGFIIDPAEALDINEPIDLVRAESMLSARQS